MIMRWGDRAPRSNTSPDMWVSGCGSRPVLWGGLGTGDAVTRGSSFKSDDAVEVGGSVNRAGVTDSGPSVRFDSYHPDETSQVRQRDSTPRFAARPVGAPLSDAPQRPSSGLKTCPPTALISRDVWGVLDVAGAGVSCVVDALSPARLRRTASPFPFRCRPFKFDAV